MRILVSGGTGLVGRELCRQLTAAGHSVSILSRSPGTNRIVWNPEKEIEDTHALEGFDAVIHLAGENIADSRWSEQKKRRILDSRVIGTRHLVKAISKLKNKPKVFIGASAIGIYGHRPHEKLNENSSPGNGFLPHSCIAWEKQSAPLEDIGIRVALMRIGIVIDKEGGALKKMLLPFSLYLGGIVGDGSCMLSWISNVDLCRMFLFVLKDDSLTGVFNACGPEPVSNRELSQTLADKLNRPCKLPIPEFALKIIFGEMAKHTILSSMEVYPERLEDAGFEFSHKTISEALNATL